MAIKLEEVKKKTAPPPVERRASDPAAGQRPKAEQVKRNKKCAEAKKAAEEAYKAKMAELNQEVNVELEGAKSDVIKFTQMVESNKNIIKELEAELEEVSDGEKRGLRMKIGKAKKQVENAEERLAEAKANVKKLG